MKRRWYESWPPFLPGPSEAIPLIFAWSPPRKVVSTDLRQGWLLDTRLREQRLLQNVVRQSEVMAIGMGSVLTRADYTPSQRRSHAGRRTRSSRAVGCKSDSQTRTDPATEVPTRQAGQVDCRRGESSILLLRWNHSARHRHGDRGRLTSKWRCIPAIDTTCPG